MKSRRLKRLEKKRLKKAARKGIDTLNNDIWQINNENGDGGREEKSSPKEELEDLRNDRECYEGCGKRNNQTEGNKLARKKPKHTHITYKTSEKPVNFKKETTVKTIIYTPIDSVEIEDRDNNCPEKKRELSKEKIAEIRNAKNEHRKFIGQLPKLIIKGPCISADMTQNVSSRVPVLFSDIQHFIIYSQLGHMSTGNIPRWLCLEKYNQLTQRIFLMVEGISAGDYASYCEQLTGLNRFKVKAEVITPACYGGSTVEELATVPLSDTQRKRLLKKYGNLEACGKVYNMLKMVFTFSSNVALKGGPTVVVPDKFPRTKLLLTPWEMVLENYPIPLKGELSQKYADYVMTCDSYVEVSAQSPMWGLDCEMCMTPAGSELTRVTVVNEQHEVVYNSLVKPYNPITNYLTKFSGITKKMLEDVNTRLEDVQRDLRAIIPPDCILVGQSLNMDLHALKMIHPYVIDTSIVFNISGERSRKSKLRVLVLEFLSETIQGSDKGHDSKEDAISALKLVQKKLQHSIEWGDAVLAGPNLGKTEPKCFEAFDEDPSESKADTDCPTQPLVVSLKMNETNNIQQVSRFTTSLFQHLVGFEKTVALVGKENVISNYKEYMPDLEKYGDKYRVKCSTEKKRKRIVNKLIEESSGVNLAIAHIKKATIFEVDCWANKLLDECKELALVCIVLAGNAQEREHGLCCVHIKPTSLPRIYIQ